MVSAKVVPYGVKGAWMPRLVSLSQTSMNMDISLRWNLRGSRLCYWKLQLTGKRSIDHRHHLLLLPAYYQFWVKEHVPFER